MSDPETRIACLFARCRCGAARAGIVVAAAAAYWGPVSGPKNKSDTFYGRSNGDETLLGSTFEHNSRPIT